MKEKLLKILAEVCEEESIEDMEIDLFGEDLLDSLGFAELLVAIEDEMGIVISPSEVDRDDMATPSKILAVIESGSCR